MKLTITLTFRSPIAVRVERPRRKRRAVPQVVLAAARFTPVSLEQVPCDAVEVRA